MSAQQAVRTCLARLVSRFAWRGVAVFVAMFVSVGAVRAQATTGSGSSASNPYGVTAPGVVQQPQQTGAAGTTYNMPTSGGNQLGQMPSLGQQSSTQQPFGATQINGMSLYPDPKQYVIGAGDLISLRLYGVADYSSTDRISADGTIQLPLIGALTLANLTIRQAEDLVADRLRSAGMYKSPEVIITVMETSSPQVITFVGEMHGIYPIQGRRNLLDVLSASGGLPASAGRTVSIIRPGVEEPILVDIGSTPQELIKANIPVYPKDTIFVTRAGFVYMVGAFRTQGAFPLQPGRTTLMQLAALAGGPIYAADYGDLRIVRTMGANRTEVKVDIKKVLYGKAPDPEMVAGDIIFLPTSQFKAALSNGGISTLLGVVSIIILATLRN